MTAFSSLPFSHSSCPSSPCTPTTSSSPSCRNHSWPTLGRWHLQNWVERDKKETNMHACLFYTRAWQIETRRGEATFTAPQIQEWVQPRSNSCLSSIRSLLRQVLSMPKLDDLERAEKGIPEYCHIHHPHCLVSYIIDLGFLFHRNHL